MVIDFHTHTFPDSIAEKAVAHLSRVGHTAAFTDAKRDTLVQSMKENHIDISVVLPVATAPTQVSGINALSAKINGRDGAFILTTCVTCALWRRRQSADCILSHTPA